MLNEKELKEVNKLSEPLQQKVKEWSDLFDRVKKSHSLDTYMTILKQKHAWQKEIDVNPFTIRGTKQGGETSRQDTETAMKIIKLLPDLDEDLEKIFGKLTADEKAQAREKAGAAENLLDLHLKKKNGEAIA